MLLNIVSFKPWPVAICSLLLYIIFVTPSIVTHETVPSPPSNPEQPFRGVNVTEAWLDLLTLTNKYHPFPSRRNEELREWLLDRIQTILKRNKVDWTNSSAGGIPPLDRDADEEEPSLAAYGTRSPHPRSHVALDSIQKRSTGPAATIFTDTISNVSMATYRIQNASWTGDRDQALGLYFEATNIFVYIRGSEDDDGEWWNPRGSTGEYRCTCQCPCRLVSGTSNGITKLPHFSLPDC